MGGICPCAPTCTTAMTLQQLIHLLGYDYEELPFAQGNDEEVTRIITAVRASIDRGIPALVWNAFSPCEWNVVTGYNDAEKSFLIEAHGMDATAITRTLTGRSSGRKLGWWERWPSYSKGSPASFAGVTPKLQRSPKPSVTPTTGRIPTRSAGPIGSSFRARPFSTVGLKTSQHRTRSAVLATPIASIFMQAVMLGQKIFCGRFPGTIPVRRTH